MEQPDKETLTRRKFIRSAASTTAVGAATIAGSNGMAADQHAEHDHQAVPPDIALRVRALETVLSEKGLIDPAAIDEVVERYQNQVGPQNGARVVARAWSDPDFLDSDCWQTVLKPSARWASWAPKLIIWWWWRIRPGCITWWSVPFVPVTHGRYWVCRLAGTSRQPTAPVQ